MVTNDETTKFRRVEFTTTHWSVILSAGLEESEGASEAMEQLCRTYWFPLYSFVRWQGFAPAEAQDIIQGFFEQFLEKEYLKSVDRDLGRFRSFLLASIKHYIMNERKRAGRKKRGGDVTILSLDQEEIESRHRADACLESSPEKAFDHRWATTVMGQAMERLETEYGESGKGELFQRLKKFLSTDPDEGEYAALASALDMTKSAVSVGVHRLRQHYGELIRVEVAHTVTHAFEVEDEMRYLYSILTG